MKAPLISEEYQSFHAQCVVVDLHVDVLIQRRLFGYDIRRKHEPWMRRQPFFRHADIPRMLEGGYSAAVLGIHYWPWESKRAWKEVRKQLHEMEKLLQDDSRVLLATSAQDIQQAHAEKKLALMAGLEGAHLLAGELGHLDEARERGVVYLTLAHFSRNFAATPGIGRGSNQSQGLTEAGKRLVKRLNELQIIVDLAHVNEAGVLDACACSEAPLIASHSCAIGRYPTARGLSDEGLRAIAETQGVVGVIFAPHFLCGKLDASLDEVVEQTLYIADLIGPAHLALGTDFDGWIPSIPREIRDCRDLALLTQKLCERGFSKEEVKGILGDNFLRVLREVRGA